VSRRPYFVADGNPITMKWQAINYDVKDFAPSDCIIELYKKYVCEAKKPQCLIFAISLSNLSVF